MIGTERELDVFLAKWRGFVKSQQGHWWLDNTVLVELRFTKSVDACLKWIVPGLHEGYVEKVEFIYRVGETGDEIICRIRGAALDENGKAKTEALALARAAKKVIDNG